jgi:Domain of unknown function (DUF4388)
MRGLMGSFAILPLGELLELLGRRGLAGTLTCERGTVKKSVQLGGGNAVGASSNDSRDQLGQLLVNFNHLDEAAMQRAIQVQQETHVRIGRVLVMIELVKPEVLREVLAIKIRETLLDVLLWESGIFHFDDTPPAPVDELDTAVPLTEVLREAEFRATAWSAFRGEFPSGVGTLEVDDARVPATMTPDTVDGRLLKLAREGRTIDELGLALRATDFHLYQRLYALARQGIVRAAPARHSGGDPGPSGLGAADLIERARGLVADGRADDAELVATRALARAPNSVEAHDVLVEAERLLSQQLRADLLETGRVARRLVEAGAIASLKLSNVDKYLLSRCDGVRTVRQLAQMAPLRELDVLKALRRLADGGVVELR